MGGHDKAGRPYARLAALRPGDQVEADGGFDCIAAGQVLTVEADDGGDMFVRCSYGNFHYLDGQIDGGSDHLIGFYHAAPIAGDGA